eukprot:5798556-Ditylum_brightwellii.AAC.1
MDQIQRVYTVKLVGPLEYYLGNNFKKDSKGRWMMGCKKYITETLTCIQTLFGVFSKHDMPMVLGDRPEMDNSPTLSDVDHQKYQMLISMLNWIVILGYIDIAYSVASLVRFVACPHQGHTDRALYVFGYLKKRPNWRITIDFCDPIVVKNGAEGLLDIDVAVKLRNSILRTLIMFMSKQQGAVETSTYGAEFMTMKTVVEEVMALRYMLWCLGIKVTKPTRIL